MSAGTPYLDAVAIPIDDCNVDTDQIIPIHRLRDLSKRKGAFGDSCFYNRRFALDGTPIAGNPFDCPAYHGAQILVTAENFGCGSSRETAVWALADYGIRAILGPSFSDIFQQNCATNGVLLVPLPAPIANETRSRLHENPGARIAIDLQSDCVILPDGRSVGFEIDGFRKKLLMKGGDQIAFTHGMASEIDSWEFSRHRARPWLQLPPVYPVRRAS